jgi:long-chain acyl-CoA synthetase
MNAFDYFFEKSADLKKPFLEGQENTSFRQLHKSSLNLACYIEQEFGNNKNILLISVNNLFFITAYLAILKSGNICIPLDPGIERDNFTYIKELTNPVLIFLTKDIEQKLSVSSIKCISSEIIPKLFHVVNRPLKNRSVSEDDLAEIIFTSGSTGKPKGVMLTHKNLIANTRSITEYLSLSQNDRMLVVLPFYYCYGLSLLHTHLRVGGSIVLNNSFIFLQTIINDLLEYKCSGFAGVPSHFQILLRISDSFKYTSFPDLKYVTQAGGKLATVFIDEFRSFLPNIKFYVMYGQTEATARLSYLPPAYYEKKKGSIGKGIPGVELKVINKDGGTVNPGETGEIIAKGSNIMSGYFSDEEETLKVLRDGWLYTGDLGTLDGDGFIYLTAREKEIIKVGGKRISPKEIESVILELPEVVDCTIEGVIDDLLGEAIKATIVFNPNLLEKPSSDIIREHCRKYLAIHKIPQVIEIKKQISISTTGKKIKGNLSK